MPHKLEFLENETHEAYQERQERIRAEVQEFENLRRSITSFCLTLEKAWHSRGFERAWLSIMFERLDADDRAYVISRFRDEEAELMQERIGK